MSTQLKYFNKLEISMILFAILSISIVACSFMDDTWVGQWCHVRSGLFLVYGEPKCDEIFEEEKAKWDSSGKIAEVFDYYNKDEELELFQTTTHNQTDIETWISNGYRLAISYKTGSGKDEYHCERIKSIEEYQSHEVYKVFVAGYFNY